MVAMKPAGQLLAEYGAASVLYIKIDCEGFDYRIMHSILDYYEANQNTTRFPVAFQYEDIRSAVDNGRVANRLVSLGYRVYHVRYRVSKPLHTTEDPGNNGELFAELADPGEDRQVAFDGISHLLPAEFMQHRNACFKYQVVTMLRAQGTADANATASTIDVLNPNVTLDIRISDTESKPVGFFCSVLMSVNDTLLSVSNQYVVYA
jgi:hypothetical protein